MASAAHQCAAEHQLRITDLDERWSILNYAALYITFPLCHLNFIETGGKKLLDANEVYRCEVLHYTGRCL
jgi:hypothetical protein